MKYDHTRGIKMKNQQIPGHVTTEQFNQMLLPPESFAAKPESLTEPLFIERSLTENRLWLRVYEGTRFIPG
jgi:hypothetical protein